MCLHDASFESRRTVLPDCGRAGFDLSISNSEVAYAEAVRGSDHRSRDDFEDASVSRRAELVAAVLHDLGETTRWRKLWNHCFKNRNRTICSVKNKIERRASWLLQQKAQRKRPEKSIVTLDSRRKPGWRRKARRLPERKRRLAFPQNPHR